MDESDNMEKSNNEFWSIVNDTKVFEDLDRIKILKSGVFGKFYLNGEKVLLDECWRASELVGDSLLMLEYCKSILDKNDKYKQVIEALAQKADDYFANKLWLNEKTRYAISGGETRDFLFSLPVANALELPHLSVYKNGSVELIDMKKYAKSSNTSGYHTVHIPDMLTSGSSFVDNSEAQKGWIYTIQDGGSKICHVITFLNRQQGGEEELRKYGIGVESLVDIDHKFLEEFSSNPKDAINSKDGNKFTKDYILTHGIEGFMHEFDPGTAKIAHVENFMKKFGSFMKANISPDDFDKVSSAYEALKVKK